VQPAASHLLVVISINNKIQVAVAGNFDWTNDANVNQQVAGKLEAIVFASINTNAIKPDNRTRTRPVARISDFIDPVGRKTAAFFSEIHCSIP